MLQKLAVCSLFVFFGARGAGAFDDEGDGVGDEVGGEVNVRDGGILQAKGLLAGLAIEMEMTIGVAALTIVVVAEFIMDNTAPVLKSMHYIVLLKECEDTENARLVQIEHLVFQILETHGAVETHQSAIDQDTIDRRFDRLMLQVVYDGSGVHCSYLFYSINVR